MLPALPLYRKKSCCFRKAGCTKKNLGWNSCKKKQDVEDKLTRWGIHWLLDGRGRFGGETGVSCFVALRLLSSFEEGG